MATKIGIENVDGDVGFALVDRIENRVRRVVSLPADGDYDLLLEPRAARALGEALSKAAREEQ